MKPEKKQQADEESIRQQIRVRFREMIAAEPVFHLPTLAQALTREMASNHGFARQFVATMAYTMVAEVCRSVVHESRAGRVGNHYFTADALRKETTIKTSIFASHREFDGQNYHLLTKLTKPTALKAIAYRRKGIETEQLYIELLTKLIRPLKPNQTIGSKWTLQDIDQIWTNLTTSSQEKTA